MHRIGCSGAKPSCESGRKSCESEPRHAATTNPPGDIRCSLSDTSARPQRSNRPQGPRPLSGFSVRTARGQRGQVGRTDEQDCRQSGSSCYPVKKLLPPRKPLNACDWQSVRVFRGIRQVTNLPAAPALPASPKRFAAASARRVLLPFRESLVRKRFEMI